MKTIYKQFIGSNKHLLRSVYMFIHFWLHLSHALQLGKGALACTGGRMLAPRTCRDATRTDGQSTFLRACRALCEPQVLLVPEGHWNLKNCQLQDCHAAALLECVLLWLVLYTPMQCYRIFLNSLFLSFPHLCSFGLLCVASLFVFIVWFLLFSNLLMFVVIFFLLLLLMSTVILKPSINTKDFTFIFLLWKANRLMWCFPNTAPSWWVEHVLLQGAELC